MRFLTVAALFATPLCGRAHCTSTLTLICWELARLGSHDLADHGLDLLKSDASLRSQPILMLLELRLLARMQHVHRQVAPRRSALIKLCNIHLQLRPHLIVGQVHELVELFMHEAALQDPLHLLEGAHGRDDA
jgi:hypothetical protein